ncbi:MAG: FkbM family methyltransferase [Phycisphaerales bacterium]
MPAVLEHLIARLGAVPAPTILELGVHLGQDTLELRRLFPSARILAVEPDPRNIYKLKRSGFERIATLVEAAIGDHEGKAELHLSSGTPPAGTMGAPGPGKGQTWTQSSSLKRPTGHIERVPWVRFEGRAVVPVVTLDALCGQHGVEHVDLIWADVQGAEDRMIAGGTRTLARTDLLYTEYSDTEIYEGQINLAEILRRLPVPFRVVEDYGADVLLARAAGDHGSGSER